MMKRILSLLLLALVLCSTAFAELTFDFGSGFDFGSDSGSASGFGAAAEDEDWLLMLVNADNPIPDDFVVGELVEVRGGEKIDRRILPALQEMFDAARANGVYPYVRSGYRTQEDQEEILMSKYNSYRNQGYSKEEAQKLTLEWVAYPGTSEHQIGICADINSTGEDNWTVYSWLAKHAWKYGFILRYPEDKVDITGVQYEPWHYRYVGKEAAKEIYESGLTLEEYLGQANYW